MATEPAPPAARRRFVAGRLTYAALAVGAGLAVALAFPPFGVLPGLLGFALLMHLSGASDAQRPLRSAFWRGWLAGFGFFLVSTWWVYQAFQVDAAEQGWMAPFAVVLLAGGLALFWGGVALLYRLIAPRGIAAGLVFTGLIVGAEWVRGHLLTGFPWDLPGESWRAGSAPSQAASLVGAYGLSWITVAIACAPALLADRARRRTAVAALVLAVAALVGLYAFGLARLAHTAPTPTDAPVVRVVQSGLPEVASYDQASYATAVRTHLALTAQAAARAPDIVVWPERSIPGSFDDYLKLGTWTRDALVAAMQPGQILITGGYRSDVAPMGVYAPDGLAYYNSLIVVQRLGAALEPVALYDKYRLVPFGEYIPLARWLAPLHVQELVHVGDGFTPGPKPKAIEIDNAPPVQPLICYEALYPGFTRAGAIASGRRAAWIVNVSDDAWFGGTYGPVQSLNLASYRAIEEGLPMVRATPTGVSAIIDAYGRSPQALRLAQGRSGVVDAPLPAALAPTAYDRYGDAPFVIMMLISLTGVLWSGANERIEKFVTAANSYRKR